MNLLILATLLAIAHGKHKHHPILYYQPEQVHISLGENPLEVVVTWSTFTNTPDSVVVYGIGHANLKAEGTSKPFVDGGPLKNTQYIHRVKLTGLKQFTRYVYHCGSVLAWSEQFWFRTLSNSSNWKPRIAIYGDMGNINARSLPYLQEETQNSMFDTIIHIGDFAYDMRDDNGKVGDEFMRQIQPIAAYVPYMVCPGNHEEAYHYRERFSMPGQSESLFYSFDLGPAHFIGLNTEAYYYIEYGLHILYNQFRWLQNDLKIANQPENRAKRPWIITFGHRPMYCSKKSPEDCNQHSSRVRTGLPIAEWFGLEDLFNDYNVDLEFWAHQHSYERLWPIYNYKVKNGTRFAPYTNPGAPVHIITGSAGCQERTSNFTDHLQPWSALQSTEYGFTTLEIHNKSHINIQQIAVDLGGKVIDDVWLIKDRR